MAEQIPLLFPTLIQSTESPLSQAPQAIQELFKGLKINTVKIPLEMPFERVEMPPQVCTRKILKNQKYFSCKECCYDTEIVQMIYCEECFKPEKHEGHQTEQKISPIDDASCDCGRNLRIDEKSFCENHCQKQIKVQIPEQKQKQFNKFFGSLFQIYLFLKEQDEDIVEKIEQILDQKLSQLCKNSLYYMRLTAKLLETPCKSDLEENSTYLLEVLDSFRFVNLISTLSADREFLMKFAFIFMKEDEKDMKNLFPFKYARDQMLDSKEILLALAKQSIFAEDKLSNYLKVVEEGETGFEMMSRFYERIQQKQDPKEFLMLLTKEFKKKGSIKPFQGIEIAPFLLNLFLKTMNKKVQLNETDKQWFPETFSFVCDLIINLCDEKIQQVTNLSKFVEIKKCKFSELEVFEFITKLFDFNGIWGQFQQKMRTPTLVTLILTKNLQNRDQLVEKAWKKIISKDNFQQNVESIYGFISLLTTSYRKYPILALRDEFSGKPEIQLKQEIFRSYLYESQQVGKDKLWKQYNNGWLNFSSVPDIIRELCRYKEETQVFIYDKPNKNFQNKILKIQDSLTRNWQNLHSMNVSMDKNFEIYSSTLKEIFQTIFQSASFFNIFKEKFDFQLAKLERDADLSQKWKKKSIGQVYILLFVLFDKFCDGKQSVQIKRELQKITNDPDYRFKFEYYGDRKRIFQLLNISKNFLNEEDEGLIEEKDEREEREKEERKRKTEEKKNKLMEKYSKKREVTLQKYASKQSEQIQQEAEQVECLICHEKQKKDKKMVFMSSLRINDTVAKVLHGDEVKIGTVIDTCFHTIHIPCFMAMKKKNMGFACPLCSKNINCFLPINPQITEKKVWKMSWNILNALLVCQFEMCEVQSLFSLIFGAYVQNKGISRLIMEGLGTVDNKRKQRMDCYLDTLMVNIFESTSRQTRQEFEQQYKDILLKVQECKKPHFQKIQKLIIKSCWQSLKDGIVEIDESQLQQLFAIMHESEANILIKILQQICGETNQYDFKAIYNKQKQENKMTEKVTFGINILRPQKKINEMLKTKDNRKCDGCESAAISSQCMLCLKFMCTQCEDDDLHKRDHSGKTIRFQFNDGTVKVSKGPRDSNNIHIYFNDFMINYKKGQEFKKNSSTYWLNQNALDKAIKNFLEIRI